MAEEEVVVVTSVVVSDLKRKLVDLDEEEKAGAAELIPQDSVGEGDTDAKRIRVDVNEEPDKLVEEKGDACEGTEIENYKDLDSGDQVVDGENEHIEDQEEVPVVQKTSGNGVDEDSAGGDYSDEHNVHVSHHHAENEASDIKSVDSKEDPITSNEEVKVSTHVDVEPTDDSVINTRKVEIPNDKVGVLIGKGGETIRYIQFNSEAKIQILRDAEADLHSATRPVEIVGKLSSILRAEKLIAAVIAEAEAGGSPALVARGLSSGQATGLGEHIEMQVPNDKVGLIIGRRGENIKNLQGRSGAHIQLIPQHLPEGDGSKDRTVRVTGDRRQIEIAREMIMDIMNQTMRASSSGGYNQQHLYGHSAPGGPPYWGQRTHSSHPMPYDYSQRGVYQTPNSHFGPSNYGGGYPLQMAPRGNNMVPGWDSRPPPHSGMHGQFSQGVGYDYYGGRSHTSAPAPSAMGPPYQPSYNYGQSHGSNYGHQPPYTFLPQQSYEDAKFDSSLTHYGGIYPQGASQPAYAAQQHYGKQPTYGMVSQEPQPHSYAPPRASQPGEVPFQGSSQAYGSHLLSQPQYPYPPTAPSQQTYTTDGYNQTAAATGTGYTQQSTQPLPAYGQQGGQQVAAGYAHAQSGAGAYASYTSQQTYPEQPAGNTATTVGYQMSQDPAFAANSGMTYAASNTTQVTYTQPPAASQTTSQSTAYDHSAATQQSGFGAVAATAPATYGKPVSPRPAYPQYATSQVYAAPN